MARLLSSILYVKSGCFMELLFPAKSS